jgi:hypothetical protein
MGKLTFKPLGIATDSTDEEGCLVFKDTRLVAVLVRLPELHGEAEGAWFIETGFGRLEMGSVSSFPDLEAAEAWMLSTLSKPALTDGRDESAEN